MAESPWLNASEARAWRGWLTAGDLLRARISHDLWSESGLSGADFTVLVYLSETPDHRVRMSDLAGALRWSKSRVSHQVTRMESRGLVVRQGCDSDARGSFAVLTGRGLTEIEKAAPKHVAGVRRNFIDLLSEDQQVLLAEVTDVVIDHLLRLPGSAPDGSAWPRAAVVTAADEGKVVG